MSRSLGSAVFGVAFAVAAGASAADCPLDVTTTGRVAAILSGDSLVLDSGLPVRLASVGVPGEASNHAAAAAALGELLTGREVEIRLASPDPDRYGRSLAQIFIRGAPAPGASAPGASAPGASAPGGPAPGGPAPGPPALWLQAALVERGLLEVRTTPEDASCARALLALEAMAREAHAGFWTDGALAPLRAGDPALAEHRGSYAAVEGRVISTGSTERTVFLNFGYDWSADFTVTMSAADAAAFDFSGIGVEGLSGRLVRVRGWLEERDGATIRIDHAEQIEILDVGG